MSGVRCERFEVADVEELKAEGQKVKASQGDVKVPD